jgi:alkylresorcinol/alkylpyrone synthase
MIPRLLALKSAVPPYTLDQTDVSARAAELFQNQRDITRLLPVFENTGIERRYSCVPIEWYSEPHGWIDRTNLYVEHAVALLARLTEELLEQAKLTRDDLDAIVVASTTGV